MTATVKSVDGAGLFWDGLAQELAAWQAGGRRATFWNCETTTPSRRPGAGALGRPERDGGAPSACRHPQADRAELALAVAGHSTVWLLQHGFAHIDHAKVW
jgi:hypothetical protein